MQRYVRDQPSPAAGTRERRERRAGLVPSVRLGRMVSYRNLVGRDLLYVLDQARPDDVRDFTDVTPTFRYKANGHRGAYSPHLLVTAGWQRVLVECVRDIYLPEYLAGQRYQTLQLEAALQGYALQVVTDSQLSAGSYLENAKLLAQYARLRLEPTVRAVAFGLLASSAEPLTLRALAEALAPHDYTAGIAALLHLAFYHEVALPMYLGPFGGDTPVCLPYQSPTPPTHPVINQFKQRRPNLCQHNDLA
jgi:hypothetical protein